MACFNHQLQVFRGSCECIMAVYNLIYRKLGVGGGLLVLFAGFGRNYLKRKHFNSWALA